MKRFGCLLVLALLALGCESKSPEERTPAPVEGPTGSSEEQGSNEASPPEDEAADTNAAAESADGETGADTATAAPCETPGGPLAIVDLHLDTSARSPRPGAGGMDEADDRNDTAERSDSLEAWSKGDNALAWGPGTRVLQLDGDCWRSLPFAPADVLAGRVRPADVDHAGIAEIVTVKGTYRLQNDKWLFTGELPAPSMRRVSGSRPGERQWFLAGASLWRWDADGWTERGLPVLSRPLQAPIPTSPESVRFAHQRRIDDGETSRTSPLLLVTANALHRFRDGEWSQDAASIADPFDVWSTWTEAGWQHLLFDHRSVGQPEGTDTTGARLRIFYAGTMATTETIDAWAVLDERRGARWVGVLPREGRLHALLRAPESSAKGADDDQDGDDTTRGATLALELDPPFQRATAWTWQRGPLPAPARPATIVELGGHVVALAPDEALRFSDVARLRTVARSDPEQAPDAVAPAGSLSAAPDGADPLSRLSPSRPVPEVGECGVEGGLKAAAQAYLDGEIDGIWGDGETLVAWTHEDALVHRDGCLRWLPRPGYLISQVVARDDTLWVLSSRVSLRLANERWVPAPQPHGTVMSLYHAGAGVVATSADAHDGRELWLHRNDGWWALSDAPENAPSPDTLTAVHQRGPETFLVFAGRAAHTLATTWRKPREVDLRGQHHVATHSDLTYAPGASVVHVFDGESWSRQPVPEELFVDGLFVVDGTVWATARVRSDPATATGRAFLRREGDAWTEAKRFTGDLDYGRRADMLNEERAPVVFGDGALVIPYTSEVDERIVFLLDDGEWQDLWRDDADE